MKRIKLFLFSLLLGTAVGASAQEAYDTDRGFIHPGGLHTQTDFDRVKRQLAEGNAKVTAAYEILRTAAYAQAGVTSSPVVTIIRGGGSGENYMNAARATAMAYQNGLRWKIEGNKNCAQTAVSILMAWARTTTGIGGDSNYALAAGLYGYQFAQAAELVRDYEGWSSEDFSEFQQWMLNVWYPSSIGFLRGRNGTWENSSRWWQAPGAYWSNWGLCNALCVISIGILCDDVFIYNQGMSFFKYDQVGTYADPHTLYEVTGHDDYNGTFCMHNDGLTEFLGNMVVTHVASELETAAYGELGQLNESGRDAGHSSMSLGVAFDLAKVGWNQGDDLFAYMNHRLAAGTEYLAAQTQSVDSLPWTNYMYGDAGLYYTDSRAWLMTAPAMEAQSRPYWGTVIGIYEGVKGVKMPFSEKAYEDMGIDTGGLGATSGGYDHLGYSVLMNTRDTRLAPADSVPTELSPKMEYSNPLTASLIPSLSVEQTLGNVDGQVSLHNELGGLVNNYNVNTNTCVPRGQEVKLMPQLPDGVTDTGLWEWNTGETTRDITVSTDRSYIYRVTYTNDKGVKSQLCFPIAVVNDCRTTPLTPSITNGGATINDTTITVLYSRSITLSVTPTCGWGAYQWSTGATTQSITVGPLTKPATYSVTYTNQGSGTTTCTFHINVVYAEPYIAYGDSTYSSTEIVAVQGDSLTLGLNMPAVINATKYVSWSDGTTGKTLALDNVRTSGSYTATLNYRDSLNVYGFRVLVYNDDTVRIEPGDYMLLNVRDGRLLTGRNDRLPATFEQGDTLAPGERQVWHINNRDYLRYSFQNITDSTFLSSLGRASTSESFNFRFKQAVGTDLLALHIGTGTSAKYWSVNADGSFDNSANQCTDFPFRLIPCREAVAIHTLMNDNRSAVRTTEYFTTDGMRHSHLQRGVNIVRLHYDDGTLRTRKVFIP